MKIPIDSLAGKVALVTGAGSGIGKASALLLAQAGARVGVLGHSRDNISGTVDEIRESGGEALLLLADVSKSREVQNAIVQLQEQWQRLDIVLANAGINGVWAPLSQLHEDEWEKTLAINLTGTFLTIKHAEPYLKKEGGSVIVTSSVNGTRMFSNRGATAYACSKAGQLALVKMLALELAAEKIRVNVICPGAIESDIEQSTERRDLGEGHLPVEFPEGMVPLGHGEIGKARQVAELVWFLASDASSHISGTEIYIDGAQSLLQG